MPVVYALWVLNHLYPITYVLTELQTYRICQLQQELRKQLKLLKLGVTKHVNAA